MNGKFNALCVDGIYGCLHGTGLYSRNGSTPESTLKLLRREGLGAELYALGFTAPVDSVNLQHF